MAIFGFSYVYLAYTYRNINHKFRTLDNIHVSEFLNLSFRHFSHRFFHSDINHPVLFQIFEVITQHN